LGARFGQSTSLLFKKDGSENTVLLDELQHILTLLPGVCDFYCAIFTRDKLTYEKFTRFGSMRKLCYKFSIGKAMCQANQFIQYILTQSFDLT
jgi:hypothetical protein